ncbi:MAG: DUF3987 domain-containing protein [Phycisphaerae bacterium]
MNRFITELFGDALSAERRLAVFTVPGQQTRFFAGAAEAETYAREQSAARDVYYGVGLVRGSPSGRGKARDVAAIGALWADIDMRGPGREAKPLPVTLDEARRILERLPHAPSILVDSGHGLHAYWLLKEPWGFDTDAEREQAARLAKGWHGTVCAAAKSLGWHLENLGDLARVLRLPGTLNHKGDPPAEVRILESHPDRRYNADDFEPYLVETDDKAPAPASENLVLRPDAEPPAAKMAEAVATCPKFRDTWNHERPDLADQSQSGYDLALASIAARLGWTGQETADLLIAARRHTGEKPEKALRPDYVRRTIGRGRAAAEALPQEGPDVDLSALVSARPVDQPPPDDTTIPDPGPVPEDLLYVPGFIGELIDFCMANAPYPSLEMAFCGGVSMQAHLCGRKVRDPGDLRTNLYMLALASSSAGKNYPRQINSYLAIAANMPETVLARFASGEGIEDRLQAHPCTMYQTDEIDGILQAISKSRDARYESIMSILMTVHSSSNMMYPMRSKAGKQGGVIHQPHLTIFGTATPGHYYEALSERMLTNGFFARMTVVDTGKRALGQDPAPVDTMPERLIETAERWGAFQPGEHRGNLLGFFPRPLTVSYTDEAKEAADAYRRFADEEYGRFESRKDEAAMTVWGRANENVRKLALLYACSENHTDPKVSLAGVEWATAFITHQVRRMLFMCGEYVARDEFEGLCKRAVRILRDWHGKEGHDTLIPPWLLRRKLSLHPNDFKDAMFELGERRLVVYDRQPGKTKPTYGYRLLGAGEKTDEKTARGEKNAAEISS